MSQDESAKQSATAEDLPMEDMPELVIVSGMSGAGRTEAMHAFEDLGYFCVDNLPASLIGNLLELDRHAGAARRAPPHRRGVRRAQPRLLQRAHGRAATASTRAASTTASCSWTRPTRSSIARYKSSRRRHPLCERRHAPSHRASSESATCSSSVRELAHHVIDTTDMLPQQLRATIRELFAPGAGAAGPGRHGVLVRLQARRARATPTWSWTCASCRTPTTTRSCAPLTGPRRARARLRDVPRGDRGVREAVAGAARLRHARATWPRASSSWPSPWAARAASTAAWRWPSRRAST